MKLFVDECLSPMLARRLAEAGHLAVHPRDYGRTGEPDHEVLRRCLAEDLTVVTENAIDFRKLIGRQELHPGLIIVPSVDRETSWTLLEAAIAWLGERGDPSTVMVNHVLEIDSNGKCSLHALPAVE